jgi:colicin import membrane protein
MVKALKTFTTSAGFFDLAISAPSMKAALEAWGSNSNLFHQGFATQSSDPEIVAATMAKPGVVLKRAVGTNSAFGEHADLPTNLTKGNARPRQPPKAGKPTNRTVDAKTPNEAAHASDQERKQRKRETERDDAAREKEQKRRDQAVAAAKRALQEGEAFHQIAVGKIEEKRRVLADKSDAEEARWKKQKNELETVLRRAR